MNLKKAFTQNIVNIMGLGLCLSVASCGNLERSFVDEMDRESDSFFQAGRDFPVMSGDSGEAYRSREEINRRTPSSERKRKQMKEEKSLKDELMEKEATLSEEEMSHYLKDTKYLPTESDKLYYLSLNGSDRGSYIETKKQEYLEDHGVGKDLVKERSVHSAEIAVGMSKDEVIKMWGRPTKIQIAGNPRNQNELWLFNEDGSVRQVFFEAGTVNGWALDL